MNRQELERLFKENKIPDYLYNLYGVGNIDERFNVENTNGVWNVYFLERGIKTTSKKFDTEDEACQFLYKQFME